MTPQTDVSLAPLCTIGVGGPARWFVEARSAESVSKALEWARQRQVTTYVLGGGSNVVVADEGLDGLVVRIAITGIDTAHEDGSVVYRVGAGEPWDDFVAASVAANDAGLECLSGIPGFVGGTPVQNVGAYGQDVSGTIRCVSTVDRHTGRTLEFSNRQCAFSYRNSRFKSQDANRFVVTRVDFALRRDGPATIAYADVVQHFERAGMAAPALNDVREAVLAIRRRKGMVIEAGSRANRSCGSFFVNPIVSRDQYNRVKSLATISVPSYDIDSDHVKIPAAWLIEHSGFPKGTTRGVAGISPFQAQAIVNLGGASAQDILELACEVKRAVLQAFGVTLVPEPVFLGFPPSPPVTWLLNPYVNAGH
jgi:UDP-N-acetylmuramate dehydrogenase